MQKYCIAALALVIDTAELSSNYAFDAIQFIFGLSALPIPFGRE